MDTLLLLAQEHHTTDADKFKQVNRYWYNIHTSTSTGWLGPRNNVIMTIRVYASKSDMKQ